MQAIISGFGPFESVRVNPTTTLVERLLEEPPQGWDLAGRVLPVSFGRALGAWDELLGESPAPDVLVALGVSGRATGFHLENRARARPEPSSERGDNDGTLVSLARPSSEVDFQTTLDLDELVQRLSVATAVPVQRSDDAGAYVCERVYHHVLVRAAERGVPGLFVHVPPFEVVGEAAQIAFLHELFAALLACGVARDA